MMIVLKCANCAANLDVKEGVGHLTCGYCGAQQMVERSGGAVWLSVEQSINRVQRGTDRTAAELALTRLGGEHQQAMYHVARLNALIGSLNQNCFILPFVLSVTLAIVVMCSVVSAMSGHPDSIAPVIIGVLIWTVVTAAAIVAAVRLYRTRRGELENEKSGWEQTVDGLRSQIEQNRKIANG